MTFPVIFHIGGLSIYAHTVCEVLASTIGFQVYLRTRRRERFEIRTALLIIVGATTGALIGSKVLYWFENPTVTATHLSNMSYLLGGKTIVGGLLGGLIGVEQTKKRIGISRSTGDDFVIPLIVGMSIGRIGCFLTGLQDDTAGIATSWFTGVNFGDGIPRHPTQLYEIAFLLSMLPLILYLRKRSSIEGSLFQIFMIGYLLFRLGVDSIKMDVAIIAGLTSIQLACIAGLIYYSKFVPGIIRNLSTNDNRLRNPPGAKLAEPEIESIS